jgi:hypothetical protein
MIRAWVLLASFFLSILVATSLQAVSNSAPVTTDWVELDRAGRYREAIQLIEQKPTYDYLHFYNLGVLWGKLNQVGLATAYLEKANRLKPHEPEISRNLKLARSKLIAIAGFGNPEHPVDQASTTLESLADRIHPDEILGILGLVVLAVSLLWIRAYLKTRNIMKTLLKPSGWFGAFALSIAFAFYGVYRAGTQFPPAVILTQQTLRSGPGMNYPEITNIESGIKIRLLGAGVAVNENELWQKIRYKSEQVGWIPLSSLLPL